MEMLKRGCLFLVCLFMLVSGSILIGLGEKKQSYAFNFEPRSITLSNNQPSAVTTHTFIIAPPTTSNIGSIVFEYCDNSPLINISCTPPAGLDVSGASLSFQSGNTGFTIDGPDSTANKIVLGRANAPGIITASTYKFDNITNPSTPAQTDYVRISTYASSDGSGAFIDKGTVTFAVQSPFIVNTYVPPFLTFCVGVTVAPDCSATSGDNIDLGILSSKHASSGQSQFATATNDPTGYVIYALGNTMTSGNYTISTIGFPSPSFPGTGQFGINLRANLIPAVGQDPVGLGTAAPTPNYNQVNKYMYNSGDSIVTCSSTTNYNRMTVSYLVNVPANQNPGVYVTTLTYLATVQF